jgi:cytochrome c biogenesis protein CcmG, thiol:disulfide interchange protein DsbE
MRWRWGIPALALVAVLMVVLTSNLSADSSDDRESGVVEVGFEYFDGTEGTLADFAGRPLVVNFWASWCPACVAEMPDFEEIHARLGQEVAFLGLNMQETSEADARELVERTGVSYPLGRDPEGAIFTRFGGIAMPTTVFLDERGVVVSTHSGVLFADQLEALVRAELLDQ